MKRCLFRITIILPAIIISFFLNGVVSALNLPALDFGGNWEFVPQVEGHGKSAQVVGGDLIFSNLAVTFSLISGTEFYFADTPGVEEIIGAMVDIPVLSRDTGNNWLFGNGTFSIIEGGNTYLSADLVNVLFEPDPVTPTTTWLNFYFDLDNLINVDTSLNTQPSRFIEELDAIIIATGVTTTNVRLQLDVFSGTGDFTDSGSGSVGGKLEAPIPEPASLWFVSFGLSGLGVIQRKLKKIKKCACKRNVRL